MVSNITGLLNATTVLDLVSYSNTATDGVFASGFIMMVFFMLLLSFKNRDFIENLGTSSFACFVLSLFLVVVGVLNFYFLIQFGIGFILAAFIMYMRGNR